MKLADVRANAFAMPLNNPAYPRGPYKFYDREYVVISYRTDPDVLRAVVPEPLEVVGDTVNYEFIRMPDSTGFGDYTETGQVIPVRFRGADGVAQEDIVVVVIVIEHQVGIAAFKSDCSGIGAEARRGGRADGGDDAVCVSVE